MTPTIVFENGEPIVALGGSGGRRIATEVTQAALARLVFGFDPGECVSAPRMFTNGANLVVDRQVSQDTRASLRLRGETVEEERFDGTGVQMIAWDRSGPAVRILAASDPRKLGFAAAL
jgi:gamma-glutamyltranspeptidase/glutathione hydrolase